MRISLRAIRTNNTERKKKKDFLSVADTLNPGQESRWRTEQRSHVRLRSARDVKKSVKRNTLKGSVMTLTHYLQYLQMLYFSPWIPFDRFFPWGRLKSARVSRVPVHVFNSYTLYVWRSEARGGPLFAPRPLALLFLSNPHNVAALSSILPDETARGEREDEKRWERPVPH